MGWGSISRAVCKKYLELRKKMKGYIAGLMQEAHEKGTPVMRTLFYQFPEDKKAWDTEDQYMFGDRYLVAPILCEKARSREVYLPKGARWKDFWTEETYEGGKTILADAPLDKIPVFCRIG